MKKKTTGYLDPSGKYIRGQQAPGQDIQANWKAWSHDMQRKQYAREIIQPYKNGKPNRAFVQAYPEYSKKYFSQEVIDRTLREIA